MLLLLTQIALAADEAAPGFTMWEIWEHSGPIARAVIFILVFAQWFVIFLIGTDGRCWIELCQHRLKCLHWCLWMLSQGQAMKGICNEFYRATCANMQQAVHKVCEIAKRASFVHLTAQCFHSKGFRVKREGPYKTVDIKESPVSLGTFF